MADLMLCHLNHYSILGQVHFLIVSMLA
jgi:hypothetical protein